MSSPKNLLAIAECEVHAAGSELPAGTIKIVRHN
jgi:hypothetical protein